MRFFKKYDITKENRKLGDEYMPSGSIRVLNPYEVQKSITIDVSEPETCHVEVFKKIESNKGLRNSHDENNEGTERRTHHNTNESNDVESNKN